jgi:hypothetical protein
MNAHLRQEHRGWGITLVVSILTLIATLFWVVPIFAARWPLNKRDIMITVTGGVDWDLLLASVSLFVLGLLLFISLVMFLLSGLHPQPDE